MPKSKKVQDSSKKKARKNKGKLSTKNTNTFSIKNIINQVSNDLSIFIKNSCYIIIILCVYNLMFLNSPYVSLVCDKIPEPIIFDYNGNDIRNISWNEISGHNNYDKIRKITLERKPILIFNSPATQWKANDLWDLSNENIDNTIKYLINKMDNKNINIFKINNSNYYIDYDKLRPLGLYMKVNESNELITVKYSDMLGFIKNRKYSNINNNNDYIYYYDVISNKVNNELKDDILPIQWLKYV